MLFVPVVIILRYFYYCLRLLSLLGSPLVEEKLSLNKDGQSGPMRRLAEDVMVSRQWLESSWIGSSVQFVIFSM